MRTSRNGSETTGPENIRVDITVIEDSSPHLLAAVWSYEQSHEEILDARVQCDVIRLKKLEH